MSLQVHTTSASLSSRLNKVMIHTPSVKRDEAGDASSQQIDFNLSNSNSNSMVIDRGRSSPEKSQRPSSIVAQPEECSESPAQSSQCCLQNLLGPTVASRLSRHEFGEALSLPLPTDQTTWTYSRTKPFGTGSSTISSSSNTTGLCHIGGSAIANRSCAHRQITTTSGDSHARSPLKPTEQAQTCRERPLDFTIDNNTIQSPQPQQHLSSSSALGPLSHQGPPSHPATAAEIALGRPASYNLRSEAGNPPPMTYESRTLGRLSNRDDTARKENPGSSIADSLGDVKDRDENNTSRTSDTGLTASPGRMTPVDDSTELGAAELPRTTMGTPSTVSTAPSTDDASCGTADYKLDEASFLPNLLQGSPGHQRSNSWGEEYLLAGTSIQGASFEEGPRSWLQRSTTASYSTQQAWGAMQVARNQPRVASFRREGTGTDGYGGTFPPTSDYVLPQPQQHFVHHNRYQSQHGNDGFLSQGRPHPADARHGQPYPVHHYGHYHTGARKPAFNSAASTSEFGMPHATPPRTGRGQRLQSLGGHRSTAQGSPTSSPHQSGANPQRSSAEVLKTLLRKKACLYEPDTSRSVALVTWLVGRELALEYGFFSRQQLQSGVHACVADKIDSGIITRTKVNRCMQIILNSCFHYIIPRSDGSEEKGDVFRLAFSKNVKEDSFLLDYLPTPWNDLVVLTETVLQASVNEMEQLPTKSPTTPKPSPKNIGSAANKSPSKDGREPDDVESKRAVLLCFNENVRSAEDVFRCHNEFIRDTANAAHLQLTAKEWRTFFGKEAGRAPYLWGSFDAQTVGGEQQGGPQKQADILGRMDQDEADKFRSTWCTKRYDHDHGLCGFAHVEVNDGWLRRRPSVHPYSPKMCPHVGRSSKNAASTCFFLNECPGGVKCELAHSAEEIAYHPMIYKTEVCSALYSRLGGCRLGDVCPSLHPTAPPNRPSKKPADGRSHGLRHSRKGDHAGVSLKASSQPTGSPVVYASPAPFSSFERQLAMPGLQSLFRRQSSVVRAQVRSSSKCTCHYSPFGDDWGIISEGQAAAEPKQPASVVPPRRRT